MHKTSPTILSLAPHKAKSQENSAIAILPLHMLGVRWHRHNSVDLNKQIWVDEICLGCRPCLTKRRIMLLLLHNTLMTIVLTCCIAVEHLDILDMDGMEIPPVHAIQRCHT